MVKGKAGPKPGPVAKKAAKKPAAKKAAKPKGKAAESVKDAVEKTAGSNTIDRDRQQLAIVHRDAYAKRKAALTTAQRAMQALGKIIKGDGFTMRQIKLMVELATPEGEEALKLAIAQDLEAAQWCGAKIGTQFSLFNEPDRTPAVDRAREEGVKASMEGKTADPPYDPSTPQHAAFMEGYHAETERRVKKGITKPDPDDTETRASTLAAARGENEEPATKH